VVALCPLPFGSVDTFWVLVWTIPLALCLPFFDLRRLRAAHLAIVLPAIGLMLAVTFAVWLQTGTGGAGLVPVHPVWARAATLLGRPLAGSVSVDPAQSWNMLGRPALLLFAFLCGFAASLERDGARLLFRATAWAGLIYALYGLLAHLLDPASLLGVEKLAYLEDLTGTFVNRNTAGTFFGSIMILWWVQALLALDTRVPRSSADIRDWAAALLDSPSRKLVLSLLGWFLAFAALLMTRSRAGVLLSLGGLFVASLFLLRHRLSARTGTLATLGVVLLIGAVMLELFAGAVASRIGALGLVDQGRLSGYASALAIIIDHPLLGTGLGSFGDVFPAYRSAEISTAGTWDRAHSSPLEIAVELGAPIAIATVVLWLAALWRLARGALSRRRDVEFPASAFGIGLLGSLHALVDFSPQIAGFGVMWLALLGGGLAQSVPTDEAKRPAPTGMGALPAAGPKRGGAAGVLLRVGFAACSLTALAYVANRLPAEIEADPVVSLANRMVGGLDFDRAALDRYEPFIQRAEADESCGPLRASVAVIRTYLVQQAATQNDAPRALANIRPAFRDLRQKLACAPADGLSWFTLFTLEASLRGRAATDFPMLLMSYQLSPNEGQLMRMRSQVGTAVLQVASPELQGYVRDEFVHLARDDSRTAAGLIAGAGEPLRGILLGLLERVGLDQRTEIARQLDEDGVDVKVPGVPEKR
jgi:O-antigen ligase